MKYYLDEKTTPLTFHAFLKWVSLPLGILKTIGEMTSLSRGYTFGEGEWVTMVGIVLLVDLVLMAVALVGLIRMEGFGWTALMTHLGLMAGYALVTLGIVAQYGTPDAMSMALSELVVSLVYGGLVGLYYIKRRYLFFPEKVPAELALARQREEWTASEVERLAPDAPTPSVVYCRHCGQRLLPNSAFCSGCGARVDGDETE